MKNSHKVFYKQTAKNYRNKIFYPVILILFLLISFWQIHEYYRFKLIKQNNLREKASDITTIISLLVRNLNNSGMIESENLKTTLQQLLFTNNLSSINLLNSSGNTLVSVGKNKIGNDSFFKKENERWLDSTVFFASLISLGKNL